MSATLAAQICRIVAPERLSDRFLSSGVLTASDNRNLNEQVVLAYVFEVMQPWLPSTALLPSLINALETEYPKLVDPNNQGLIDDKFELLLRTVNQTLNSVSESGETDWIGNLNGIIMVLSGEELHFSQTGQCPAYLLQNNRIRQVTDEAAPAQDPHPLKTFSNLATGVLKGGDQLLVANRELYREISLDALRRILNTASPYQSAQAIAKELKRQKNPAVSTLIMKFHEGAPAQAEPESVILEEEMQSGFKKFGRKVAPVLDKAKIITVNAGVATVAAAKQAQGAFNEKVAPKVAEAVQKGKEAIAKPSTEAPSEAAKSEAAPEKPVEAPPAPAPADTAEKQPEPVSTPAEETGPVVEVIYSQKQKQKMHNDAIAEAAEARINEDEEEIFESIIPDSEREMETKSTPEHKVLHSVKHHTGSVVSKILPALASLTRKVLTWLRVSANRKKAALGSGVLILALMLWIGMSAARNNDEPGAAQSNSSILTEVADLKTKIQSGITGGQTLEASKNVETALAKLSSLNEPSKSQREEADVLWNEISDFSDTLTTTTRFKESTSTFKFTDEVRGFVTSLPYFYGWNPTEASMYRTGIGTPSETQTTVDLTDTTDPILSYARSTETDTAGYALTKQGKVFRLVQNGAQTLLRSINPASGEFAVGDAVASYSGNVYILDGKAGLLWKYTNSGTSYAKGVSVIDINTYDLKKSVSLAIDGSFYILKSDGEIMKFSSGKADTSFVVQNVPYLSQKMVQPLSIITDQTYANVYVLDAGASSSERSTARVLVFNKDGTFVSQYAFPANFTKVRAFDINPKEGKLWVLNDSTIHEFTL